MKLSCQLAKTDTLNAVYTMGKLVIQATGNKPAADTVRISRSPLMIYPPQYVVNQCRTGGGMAPGLMVPYTCNESFLTAPPVAPFEITIYDVSGPHQIKIKIIDDPIKVQAPAGEPKVVGGEIPIPVHSASPAPLVMSNLFALGTATASKATTKAPQPVQSTGYSNEFSFEEAFTDAIKNLPPDPNPYPDKQIHINVVGVGALLGGILGEHKMFVSISSVY